MKSIIRIAQVSDCHLPADPQRGYRGIDSHQNLETLLQKVRKLEPDLVLATGDLSEDGSEASYLKLQQLFDSVGVPVLALPGNHDDAVLLERFFAGSPVDTVQVTTHHDWQLIRLNSCISGKPHGRFSEATITEFGDILSRDTGRPRLVAIHHQPVIVGSPWIDKYRLFEPEAFLEIVDHSQDVKAVVWGHVHQAFEDTRNGTKLLGGPSSAINGLPGTQKFTRDPSGPAFRWLELAADAGIQSDIVRV